MKKLPVLIWEIVKDSQAEKNGLRKGDSIISYDGQPINTVEQFSNMVDASAGKPKVELQFIRAETPQTVILPGGKIGVSLRDINEETLKFLLQLEKRYVQASELQPEYFEKCENVKGEISLKDLHEGFVTHIKSGDYDKLSQLQQANPNTANLFMYMLDTKEFSKKFQTAEQQQIFTEWAIAVIKEDFDRNSQIIAYNPLIINQIYQQSRLLCKEVTEETEMFCGLTETLAHREKSIAYQMIKVYLSKNIEQMIELLIKNRDTDIEEFQNVWNDLSTGLAADFPGEKTDNFEIIKKNFIALIRFSKNTSLEKMEELKLFFKEFEAARQSKNMKTVRQILKDKPEITEHSQQFLDCLKGQDKKEDSEYYRNMAEGIQKLKQSLSE